MFTKEEIAEYKEELQRNYHERTKGTYRECEDTFEWLTQEYKDICISYDLDEMTPEQFDEVAELFTKLNDEHGELTNVKRCEWNHLSEF